MKKNIERFQRQLLQLEITEFLGVAKILGIQLYEAEKIKSFEEVFDSIIKKYKELPSISRKNLNKLLSSATKRGK